MKLRRAHVVTVAIDLPIRLILNLGALGAMIFIGTLLRCVDHVTSGSIKWAGLSFVPKTLKSKGN